jgi:hypothetical protein
MKRSRLTALLLALLAAVLVGAVRVHASARPRLVALRPNATSCGGTLWRMKTLSDGDRRRVRLAPRGTTLAAIAARRAPRPQPSRRLTPFQKQTWEIVAEITNYRLEGGELRLILFDDNGYMNAVVPSPSCLLAIARNRNNMIGAWRQFTGCARPTSEWQPFGGVAYIRGIGFWSQRHTAHGTAPNGAELHPVTSFRIVSGCG